MFRHIYPTVQYYYQHRKDEIEEMTSSLDLPQKRPHPHSSNSNTGGGKNSKKRNNSNNNKHDGKKNNSNILYHNMSFEPRPSSGRPGSPHRYFDGSHEVLFLNDKQDNACHSLGNGSNIANNQGNENVDGDVTNEMMPPSSTTAPPTSSPFLTPIDQVGHQVVNRHLNGLCIITAGNVLETLLKKKLLSENAPEEHSLENSSTKYEHESNSENKAHMEGESSIKISSIEYAVSIGKDSQSARGKIRARKNKKTKQKDGQQQQQQQQQHQHNGIVSPHDPLCYITFNNGMKVQLNCCVAGTVIELNKRLDIGSAAEGGDTDGVERGEDDKYNTKEGVDVGDGNRSRFLPDPSLVLTDPLLDGHLAVILPRGNFPPVKYD